MHPFINIGTRTLKKAGSVTINLFEQLKSLKYDNNQSLQLCAKAMDRIYKDIAYDLSQSYPEHIVELPFANKEESNNSKESSNTIEGDSKKNSTNESKTAKDNNTYKWIIEPIDNLIEYSKCSEEFTLSIAIKKNDQTEQSIIYHPHSLNTYTSNKGSTAKQNFNRRLRVNDDISKLKGSLIAITLGTVREQAVNSFLNINKSLLSNMVNLRQPASVNLGLANLTMQKLDAFIAIGSNPNHCQSAILLAKEAGAIITDLNGKPYTESTTDFIAAGANLHKKILATIKAQSIVY